MKVKLLFTVCLILVVACGVTPESKFYTLEAIANETEIVDNRKITIGIDTVAVAGYVERPQIVTTKDNSELDMSEFNRWAEPLSDSVQRVLAENMSNYMKNGMAKPMNSIRRDYNYTVVVELNKFDGRFNDRAKLDAWWTVYGKEGNILTRQHTVIDTPLGDSYGDFVNKQNQLLNQLSLEIIKKIKTIK